MTEKQMKEFLNSTEVPYCDLAVFREHKCIFRYGRGISRRAIGAVVDRSERYNLYSLSKLTGATLTAMLISEGVLSLSDPVSGFLPEYAELTVRHGDSLEPATRVMTVGHIATMTAGLDYGIFEKEVTDAVRCTDGRATTRQIASALAKRPLCAEPGREFRYSLCLDVLGAVMEVATGMRLDRLVSERLWTPLGMKHTSFGERDGEGYGMGDQYEYADGVISPIGDGCRLKVSEGFHSLGAGIVSTVDDYGRFLDCLASGGCDARGKRIIPADSIELLRQPRLNERQLGCFRKWNSIYGGYSYGIGVRVMTDPALYDARIPRGEFGWNSVAGHYALVDTENKLSVMYAQHVFKHSPRANVQIHPILRSFAYDLIGK